LLLGVVEYIKVNAVFTQLCRFCLFTGLGINSIVVEEIMLYVLLMMQMGLKLVFGHNCVGVVLGLMQSTIMAW